MKNSDVLRVLLAGSSAGDRQWIIELLKSGSSWRCEFIESDSGESALQQVQAPGDPGERIADVCAAGR